MTQFPRHFLHKLSRVNLAMDTRRSILLIVFMVSLFLLWDAWMRQSTTGQADEAAGSSVQSPTGLQPAAGSDSATRSGADATIPQPSLKPEQALAPTDASITAMSTLSAGDRIVIKNRDLELVIDSSGGRIVKATLLSQQSDDYSGGFVRLFDDGVDSRYEAQTGLVFATPGGVSPPNHTILFERLPLQ